jgi:hypothetical protein
MAAASTGADRLAGRGVSLRCVAPQLRPACTRPSFLATSSQHLLGHPAALLAPHVPLHHHKPATGRQPVGGTASPVATRRCAFCRCNSHLGMHVDHAMRSSGTSKPQIRHPALPCGDMLEWPAAHLPEELLREARASMQHADGCIRTRQMCVSGGCRGGDMPHPEAPDACPAQAPVTVPSKPLRLVLHCPALPAGPPVVYCKCSDSTVTLVSSCDHHLTTSSAGGATNGRHVPSIGHPGSSQPANQRGPPHATSAQPRATPSAAAMCCYAALDGTPLLGQLLLAPPAVPPCLHDSAVVLQQTNVLMLPPWATLPHVAASTAPPGPVNVPHTSHTCVAVAHFRARVCHTHRCRFQHAMMCCKHAANLTHPAPMSPPSARPHSSPRDNTCRCRPLIAASAPSLPPVSPLAVLAYSSCVPAPSTPAHHLAGICGAVASTLGAPLIHTCIRVLPATHAMVLALHACAALARHTHARGWPRAPLPPHPSTVPSSPIKAACPVQRTLHCCTAAAVYAAACCRPASTTQSMRSSELAHSAGTAAPPGAQDALLRTLLQLECLPQNGWYSQYQPQ